MLQINVIRQNVQEAKDRLAVKNFTMPELVDKAVELDDLRKKLQLDFDTSQALVNSASKEIAGLVTKGDQAAIAAKKQEVATLKAGLQPINEQLANTEKALQEVLVLIPNLPAPAVPAGHGAEDNVVLREGGNRPQLLQGARPHWDLIKEFDLVDFETGAKITGRGFPLYKGAGARLQRSLVQYFLDFNIAAGYTEYLPPFMVNEASAYGTGQLPDKEGQMYYMPADQFYLIPTAEVPVTNIYRDTIVKAASLPVKMTAYSPCFRREAGSFGKDVRGLNRVHQFEKVEIVQLTDPEKSYEALEEMVAHVEKLLASLELPYRILKLCGGDMSFTSALTYDFEVYSAAQQRWLEVSSTSNFESYQTNRMKIRFKDDNGKTRLLHSLNGSALALPRIMACLLENNQQEKEIILPKALHSYFGRETIKK